MTVQWLTVLTPDGPFGIVANEEAVLASGWTDDISSLVAAIHPSLRPDSLPRESGLSFDAAPAAVNAYYDGDFEAPLLVPIHQQASSFRLRAWTALRSIQAGYPITYADLAARAGSPLAVRAAGSACATNPAALFQPCHRVVRTGGALGGFGFGLEVKKALLARESSHND